MTELQGFCLATIFFNVVYSLPVNLQEKHPILCEYKGLTFFPGEGRYLDHVGCEVIIVRCLEGGKVDVEGKRDCSFTRTKAPTKHQTIATSTTHPTLGPVCHYEGTYYRPGEIIHEVSHKGVCFGAFCSMSATVVEFENVKCNSTTSTEDITPTTDRDVFLETGCIVDGFLYEPSEVVTRNRHKDNCVEVFCLENSLEERVIAGRC